VDLSLLKSIKPDYLMAAAVLVGAFMMMKFLPRLMAGVPFVDPKAVHDMMQSGKEVLIIDVRTPGEFTGNLGHIGGALNLEAGALASRLGDSSGQFDGLKGEPVFITCRTENRSPRAAKMLTRAGFTNVCIIKSGMAGWNRQGLPTER